MRPRDRAHRGDRLRLHRGAGARPGSIDIDFTRRQLEARGHRHQLLHGPRRRHRHLERRPARRPPAASSGSRRRCRSPATAARRTSAASCTRLFRSTPSPTDAGRRRDVVRHPAPGRPRRRPRSGITLGLEVVNRYEIERAQHRVASGGDVPPHRRAQRQGAPRRLPHEHRGIRPGAGHHRDRRPSRLLPHR